jgi:predicted RNase H-like HicB family nuclease
MSTFKIVLEKDEDGFWVASCPALLGCHSQGRTKKKAISNIKEAIAGCLEVLNERVKKPLHKDVQILKIAV